MERILEKYLKKLFKTMRAKALSWGKKGKQLVTNFHINKKKLYLRHETKTNTKN